MDTNTLSLLINDIDENEYLQTIEFLILQEKSTEKQLENLQNLQSQTNLSIHKIINHNKTIQNLAQQYTLNINSLTEVQALINKTILPNNIMEQCLFLTEQNYDVVIENLPHICHIQQHYKENPILLEQQKFEDFFQHFLLTAEQFLLNFFSKKQMSFYKDKFAKLNSQTWQLSMLQQQITVVNEKFYLKLMKYHQLISILIENDKHVLFCQQFMGFHQLEVDFISNNLKPLDKKIQKWLKEQTYFYQNGYYAVFQDIQSCKKPKLFTKIKDLNKNDSLLDKYYVDQVKETLDLLLPDQQMINAIIGHSVSYYINIDYQGDEDNQFTQFIDIYRQIPDLVNLALRKDISVSIFGPYKIENIFNPVIQVLEKLCNHSFQFGLFIVKEIDKFAVNDQQIIKNHFLTLLLDKIKESVIYKQTNDFSWISRVIAIIIQIKNNELFEPIRLYLTQQLSSITEIKYQNQIEFILKLM